MTVSKFKRGQNIRVITVANKLEISSLKNKFFISRPNPFIKFTEISIWQIGPKSQHFRPIRRLNIRNFIFKATVFKFGELLTLWKSGANAKISAQFIHNNYAR